VLCVCSRYVKVPDETEYDAMSMSSSQKSSDSSLNTSGIGLLVVSEMLQ